MDSLTHLALGHAMGMFVKGATPAAQTGAYWGAFVGNSLPDIDVPVGYLLGRGWAFHRKFTHTIPGMLILPILATGVITWAVPGSDPWLTYAWTISGVILHVFLDCLNTFGTRPFLPFSNQNLGYGVLFIMDPLILGALGLGDLAQLAGWLPKSALQGISVAMAVYVAARWLMLGRLQRRVAAPGVTRSTVTAYLLGWRFFRVCADQLEYGAISLLGTVRVLESVATASGPAVDASRQVPAVAAFLKRARFPFATLAPQDDGGYRVQWQDLFLRMRGRVGGLEVALDSNLRPLE